MGVSSIYHACLTHVAHSVSILLGGLPHTDENRFNRDRGDCMDYTERPQNVRLPASGDYVIVF